MRKIAIVSHVLPPSPSGQAVALYRLLSGMPREKYVLISREDYEGDRGEDSASVKLSARYYRLPPPYRLRIPGIAASRAAEYLNAGIAIRSRARQIAELVRREECGILIGCTGDLYDLPAAALAGRRTGLPFVPWIFDDYVYQWTGISGRIASRWEPVAIRDACALIVPNEHAQKEYERRYGIHGTIVRNPCHIPDLACLDGEERVFERGAAHIVYAGAVYHAQRDAFLNLIAAIPKLVPNRVLLHIFTAQSAAELEAQGIAGPMVVRHPHIPHSEVAAILRQADILFLPLAFRSPIQEVIRTSAPGKMGEYLSVGRPILAHVPADSFVSWYFRENGCGLVADRDDSELLASSIDQLLTDRQLGIELGIRARSAAERDFEEETVRAVFFEAIGSFTNARQHNEVRVVKIPADEGKA
ncbi:MAG: glycosyltransferase [Deltaproteobacteria bacterium]|nr:glycosyltransferase [Deltaproteobacteria bacterium]